MSISRAKARRLLSRWLLRFYMLPRLNVAVQSCPERAFARRAFHQAYDHFCRRCCYESFQQYRLNLEFSNVSLQPCEPREKLSPAPLSFQNGLITDSTFAARSNVVVARFLGRKEDKTKLYVARLLCYSEFRKRAARRVSLHPKQRGDKSQDPTGSALQ